jgi:hypothetical protein
MVVVISGIDVGIKRGVAVSVSRYSPRDIVSSLVINDATLVIKIGNKLT